MKQPNPTQPWWQSAVFYQIYPRSFADSNNDGIGDLEGIRQRLSYLQWLGVDAIWISPFFPSPMEDFGYDITDYCDVDPVFGSLTILIGYSPKRMTGKCASSSISSRITLRSSIPGSRNPDALVLVRNEIGTSGTPENRSASRPTTGSA
jgi:hypothetical protein